MASVVYQFAELEEWDVSFLNGCSCRCNYTFVGTRAPISELKHCYEKTVGHLSWEEFMALSNSRQSCSEWLIIDDGGQLFRYTGKRIQVHE